MASKRNYSSGESAELKDIELEPTPVTVQEAGTVSVAVDVPLDAVFDEPEPAAMLTADRLLQDRAKSPEVPETFFRKIAYYGTFNHHNPSGYGPSERA